MQNMMVIIIKDSRFNGESYMKSYTAIHWETIRNLLVRLFAFDFHFATYV